MELWEFQAAEQRDQFCALVDEAMGAGRCGNPSCGGNARRFVDGEKVPIEPCPNAPEPPHTMLTPGGFCPPLDHPQQDRTGALVDESTAGLVAAAGSTGILPVRVLSWDDVQAGGWLG